MPQQIPYILMLGCFDTKGEVFSFLRDCLIEQGQRVVTINTGILGTTELFPIYIESDLVAMEGGHPLKYLREKRDRGFAVDIMGKGIAKVISFLMAQGGVKAAISMGGGGGTYIALSAMREIPIGIPKLCLSTLATKDLSQQVGSKDIVLMPSVVDVAGLNSISKGLIRQAAAAICAMSDFPAGNEEKRSGRIAISMFGNTTACVDECTSLMKSMGYEVFAFHANGTGGRTMEALIREGCFDGALDITTTELADDLCGGICSSGPERLDAAIENNIPLVVVPGCLDMVNFGPMNSVPTKYKDRILYSWAPDVTLMRTDKQENVLLAEKIASKLNNAISPVTILLPLKGLSQIDSEGELFYYPEINQALFNTIKGNIMPHIKIVEVDLHINDPEFSKMAVSCLLEMLGKVNTGK